MASLAIAIISTKGYSRHTYQQNRQGSQTLELYIHIVYTLRMEFEWDEKKNQSNLEKHGIDFELAILAFEGKVVTKVDNRFDYGEIRKVCLGEVVSRVLFIVYTERGKTIRIISARKANKREVKVYYEQIEKGTA